MRTRSAEAFFKNTNYWKRWERVNEEGVELQFIRRLIEGEGSKNLKVLDIACGHGRVLKQLSEFKNVKFHGIDINKNTLVLAKKTAPWARFKVASVYKLPYPDKFFDGVIIAASFMHFEKPEKALSEATRVSNGWVFLDLSTKTNISEWLRNLGIMSRSSVPEFRYDLKDILGLLPDNFLWKIEGFYLLSHKLLTKKIFSYYEKIDILFPKLLRNKIGHSLIVVGRRKNN